MDNESGLSMTSVSSFCVLLFVAKSTQFTYATSMSSTITFSCTTDGLTLQYSKVLYAWFPYRIPCHTSFISPLALEHLQDFIFVHWHRRVQSES